MPCLPRGVKTKKLLDGGRLCATNQSNSGANASAILIGRLSPVHARKNNGLRLFLNGRFENDENHPQRSEGGFAVSNPGAMPRWGIFGEERVSQRRESGESHGPPAAKRLCIQNSHAVTVNARNTTMIEIKEEKE